jgi:hypothetical protein
MFLYNQTNISLCAQDWGVKPNHFARLAFSIANSSDRRCQFIDFGPTITGCISNICQGCFKIKHISDVYILVPPKYSVSEVMGYLKGKSSLMIFDRHANLRYKYGNRHFWCRGYYVDTVGRNEKAIQEYVRNQLQEDIAADQISLKEFTDPFTGEPVSKGK